MPVPPIQPGFQTIGDIRHRPSGPFSQHSWCCVEAAAQGARNPVMRHIASQLVDRSRHRVSNPSVSDAHPSRGSAEAALIAAIPRVGAPFIGLLGRS